MNDEKLRQLFHEMGGEKEGQIPSFARTLEGAFSCGVKTRLAKRRRVLAVTLLLLAGGPAFFFVFSASRNSALETAGDLKKHHAHRATAAGTWERVLADGKAPTDSLLNLNENSLASVPRLDESILDTLSDPKN